MEFNKQSLAKPHYGVLTSETIHTEGDQRSRDCPGHGYPASSYDVLQYTPFENQEKMEAWVKCQNKSYPNKWFQIISAEPLVVEVQVSVKYPDKTRNTNTDWKTLVKEHTGH